jgi:hypothetical protein
MLEKLREENFIISRVLWGGIFVGILFLGLLLGVGIGKTTPDLAITNDSARAFISTFNQILATILAIVISLTILAVEMTASKYSPRVIEIFKKNAFMWFFIFSYIFSIVIGSIFLIFIDNPNFPISTTTGTFFLLILGIFLLLMLIPYVLSTLEYLNTERIVKRLADLTNTNTINPQIDPFQSIFDVIYGAIKINDFTTMSTGLVCAEERFKKIIEKDPQNRNIEYIAFRFFDDVKRCGFLLIEKKEDKYAFEIITRLYTINDWAFKEQNTIVLHRSCKSIEEIGTKSCENGLVSVVDHALTTLDEIVKTIENIEGLAHNDRVTQQWSCILFSSVESIGNIGKTTIKYDLIASSRKTMNILNTLGRNALDKNLSFENDFIFKWISAIIIESISQDKNKVIISFMQILESLGEYSADQNRNKEAIWILDELKNIGILSGHQKKENAIQSAVIAIRYIAIRAMGKDIVDIKYQAIYNSTKLQFIYPEYFKDKSKIRLFDNSGYYSTEDEEGMSYAMMFEDSQLQEYLNPPDNYEDL